MGILGKMRKAISAGPVLAGNMEINAARAKNVAERAAYIKSGASATGRQGNATAKRLAAEKNALDTTDVQMQDFMGGSMQQFEQNINKRR